jgi:hypothetical protein
MEQYEFDAPDGTTSQEGMAMADSNHSTASEGRSLALVNW